MYNPYDLVPMVINGVEIFGRPIEFDSPIADYNKMENAFGNVVKPSKLSTVCPNCGQGLVVHVKLMDPPFQPIHYSCEHCIPPEPVINDPFNNPIESGRIPASELDPLLHDFSGPIAPSEEPIGDRIDVNGLAEVLEEPPEAPPSDSEAEVDQDLIDVLEPKEEQEEKPKSTKKKPTKKAAKKPTKKAPKKKASNTDFVGNALQQASDEMAEKTNKEAWQTLIDAAGPVEESEESFDDSDLAEE